MNTAIHEEVKLFIISPDKIRQQTVPPWLLQHYYEYHVGIEDPLLRETVAVYERMELALVLSTSLPEMLLK